MLLQTLLSAKAATGIAAAGLVVIGGGTAAAYTGSLPIPLQTLAHDTIGAPAAHPHTTSTEDAAPDATDTDATQSSAPAPSASPSGPDATGPAAFGLCTAFAHSGLATGSVAYQSLVTAAGGADKITAYCATIPHPGPSTLPSQAASAAGNHPSGPPTARPSQANTGHPTGAPTGHPNGRTTSVPVGPPSGVPSH